MKLLEAGIDTKEILERTVRQSRTLSTTLSYVKYDSHVPDVRQPRTLANSPLRKVLTARNADSFSFLYQENIDRWGGSGFFDPEKEVPDLSDTDLLYLPGGYPEKYLEALVNNEACRKAIRDYAEQGGRIIAECGGMIYLCEKIVTDKGEYPMCGVLPYTISARTADRKLSLGYRRFELDGKEYRGHEFHYTQFLGNIPASVCQVYNAKGEPVSTPVFRYKNVLASYTHLYLVES
jgi:cobyrinic acid a,c-diamide synthase